MKSFIKSATMQFCDLKAGDIFEYMGMYHIKTNKSENEVNAVSLATGCKCWFSDVLDVRLVNAELVVYK